MGKVAMTTSASSNSVGDLFYNYAERYSRVKDLEAKLKEEKKVLEAEAKVLADQLRNMGIRRTEMVDGRTIYVRRDTYFSIPSSKKEDAVKLFEAREEWKHLVSREPVINASRLRSWALEEERNGGLDENVVKVTKRSEVERVLVSSTWEAEAETSEEDGPF